MYQDVWLYGYNADELMHLQMLKASSIKQMLYYSKFETHPPVVSLLRYLWVQVDDSIVWVRSFSILFAVLTSIVAYCCGKLLLDARTGVLAAFLVLFSYLGFTSSFGVRNYSSYGFFMMSAYLFYIRLYLNKPHWGLNVTMYGIFSLLAILSNYTGVILVFAMAVIYLYARLREEHKILSQKTILWCATNALLAGIFLLQLKSSSAWTTEFYQAEYNELSPQQRITGILEFVFLVQFQLMALISSVEPIFIPNALGYLALLPLWIFLYLKVLSRNKECLLILIMMVVSTALYYTGKFPFVAWRHLYFYLIPMSLLLSVSLVNQLDKWGGKYKAYAFLAVILFLLSSVIYSKWDNDFIMMERVRIDPYAALQEKITALDKTALIIAPKQYAFNIMGTEDTLYKYFPKEKDTDFIIIPKGNTNLAFNPAISLFRSGKYFLNAMRQIANDNDISGYKYIYFLNTGWTDGAIRDVLGCKSLRDNIEIVLSEKANPYQANGLVFFRLPKELVFGNGNEIKSCFDADDSNNQKGNPDFEGL